MKALPVIQQIINDEIFIGDTRSQCRVTAESGWELRSTMTNGHPRGSSRYFQKRENDQIEVEIPHIKSVSITRSMDQDAATAQIIIYSHSNFRQERPEMLGSPGFYWPDHGTGESATIWSQVTKVNNLNLNSLLRTYQGYGNWNGDKPKSIVTGLETGNLTLTGVWLVDKITSGSNGMITLDCRDMMKLLIDQVVYPPIVPPQLYPLEYYPEGVTPWDSPFEQTPNSLLNDNLSGMDTTLLGAISITSHPTGKGYWVLTSDGGVHAYGPDATFYGDAVAALALSVDPGKQRAVSIVATKTGHGYTIVDTGGYVYCFGDAVFHGTVHSKFGGPNWKVIDIAPTFDGDGYWVIARDGFLYAFGNATQYVTSIPKTSLIASREANGLASPVDSYTATAIISHPTQLGIWVTNGNGEVAAYGASMNYGGVVQREGLLIHEWTHGIESTPSGNGYWMVFGTGRVFAFGDAADFGSALLFEDERQLYEGISGAMFLKIAWDIAKSSDGRGFYVVKLDGTVRAVDCHFWGDRDRKLLPSTPGNYSDMSDIVKELLLWAGFCLFSPTNAMVSSREVFGVLESTGITATTGTEFTSDQIDKKPIIDVIKTIREVVGYSSWVDEEGGFHFESPNVWQSGNFLLDGTHVDDYITLSDSALLSDYGVVIDSAALASEIIVGTFEPTEDQTGTMIARFTPPSAEQLRGIQRPYMWLNENFTEQREIDLMAELVALRLWFASRSGNVTIVGNPQIMINDQVRILERNTSETFYHYIHSVGSNHDLDTGVWSMTLTTSRVGTEEQWSVTGDEVLGAVGAHYQTSARVNRWLTGTDEFNPRTKAAHVRTNAIPDIVGVFSGTDIISAPRYLEPPLETMAPAVSMSFITVRAGDGPGILDTDIGMFDMSFRSAASGAILGDNTSYGLPQGTIATPNSFGYWPSLKAAMVGMKKGERRRVYMPTALAPPGAPFNVVGGLVIFIDLTVIYGDL